MLKKIVLATALLGIVILGIFSYRIYQAFLGPNTAFEQDTYNLKIPTNATAQQVLDSLMPALKDAETFVEVAQRKQYFKAIKAGNFYLKKGMNNNAIVNTLRSGNTPVAVVFNNQERIEDLAGRISQQLEPDSLSFLKAFKNPEFLDQINMSEKQMLALFIPNKYEFYWNTSPEQFLERMQKEYDRFWTEARRQKAAALNLSEVEVISLASIVQKETQQRDESPRVAGVYINRLKRGMKLEADPTVIYAKKLMDDDFGQVIKRVLYRDLSIDSPYNTYRYEKLPPGPIYMPDIATIDAVLNYEKHEYLFFVADIQKPGYHKFSKTLAQHNAYAAIYRRWVQQQGVFR
ncbi:MAG: endolytic transglycosylase MltG [Flavobacteriaceae bacterium]|nr:endolytic transglycosylase MltG [Flavobacteriaceae bacterium]